jgi:deoxyadenosine/deoxycytidine kinase
VRYKYISIEGNIGAGKTSLAKLLAAEYGSKLVLEQFADNPFIANFYEQPEKYAFPFELFFVAERFKQLSEMTTQTDFFYNGVITDYLFVKSTLFSKVNLSSDEYNLYMRIFDIIYKTLPAPEVIVYLHSDIARLQKNIKLRGRSYEQQIADTYLEDIQQQYFQYFRQKKDQRILIIDTSRADFVQNENHFAQIKNWLDEEIPVGLKYVTLV